MKKVLVFVSFFALTTTALAQLKFGTDFTASDSVWSVTHVKVKSNMMPYYLEGIQQTWLAANEVAKEMGQVEDYAIYSNILTDSGDYNLTLVIEFKDLAQYDAGRKKYKEFEAALNKKLAEEKRESIVKGYPEMRTIVGEYLIRKIDFK
jgi:hypothetical protein